MPLHQRVAGRQRFELVRGGDERLMGQLRQRFSHAHRVLRMGVQAGADRRAAQRQLGNVRDTVFDVLQVVRQHRRPAGDLLPGVSGVASCRWVRPILTISR